MAFNINPGKQQFSATAAQTVFTFNFAIFADTDLKVYKTLAGAVADDTADILILSTHYTVSINGTLGGTVTLLSGASLNDIITVVRSLPIARTTDYVTNGDLYAEILDLDQDYQTYLVLDQKQKWERSVVLPDTYSGSQIDFPVPEQYKLIRWNLAEDGFENIDPSTVLSSSDAAIIANVTDFTTIDTSVYTTAIVKDLDRGGTFIWSSTGTANDGTVFAGATGYWNRQYSGAVNVKWFGAKGDGITDDTVAIQNVINFAEDIYIPNGNFIISSSIYMPNNGTLAYPKNIFGNDKSKTYGAGAFNGSSVITSTFNGVLFQFRGVSGTDNIGAGQCSFSGIKIYGTGIGLGGVGIDAYKAVGITITDCVIQGMSFGVRVETWFYYSIFKNTSIIYCTVGLQTGYTIAGATADGIWNHADMSNCRFSSCTTGVKSYKAGVGLLFNNCYFEGNGTAVEAIEYSQALFTECYFEENTTRCLDMQGYTLIAGIYSTLDIKGCLFNTKITEPIRYRRTTNISLHNNYIQNAVGGAMYLLKQYTSGELAYIESSLNETSDSVGFEVYLLATARIGRWTAFRDKLATRTIGSDTGNYPNTLVYDNTLGGTINCGIADTATYLNVDAKNVTTNSFDIQFGRSTVTSGAVISHFYKGATEGVRINHGDKALNASKIRFGLFDNDIAVPVILTGSGSPEGVIAAALGSLYLNTAGGTSTTLYVKQTGTNTSSGWVAK